LPPSAFLPIGAAVLFGTLANLPVISPANAEQMAPQAPPPEFPVAAETVVVDFVVRDKGGALLRVDSGVPTLLTTLTVCPGSEMGLLGVAVDPDFDTNGFVYLYRTNPGMGGCGTSTGRFNQVVRVTVTGNTASAPTELLTGIRTDNGNHDGGGLRIASDGTLFIGAGDSGLGDNVGGPGSATNPYAQDLNSLNGKILHQPRRHHTRRQSVRRHGRRA
jgi:glucose/arabinose dehydrogenase